MGVAVRTLAGYLWKTPVCAIVWAAGIVAGGALLPLLGLPLPVPPQEVDQQTAGLCFLAGAIAVAAGIGPLSGRLGVWYPARWCILVVFIIISLGVNNAIEAAIFTSFGNPLATTLLFIPPSALLAAVAALVFARRDGVEPFAERLRRFFGARSAGSWAWRLLLALAAFPAVYFAFGTPVGLLVADTYQQEAFGLVLPPFGTIVAEQFLRSALFLIAALPVIVAWSGSRRSLAIALGVAYFVLIGLFGMIQAAWLPPWMRWLHATELLCDSMVYAWLLTVILMPRTPEARPATAEAAAA